MESHQTWKLVDLPAGRKALPARWVFAIKYNPDGTIAQYKARLVVKGFLQRPGEDYNLIESPVTTLDTVRTMLAFAAAQGLQVCHIDVAGAFLNGKLDESIYMVQPPGFEDPTHPKRVCHLIKSIYGLKQAALSWYNSITRFFTDIGFTQSTSDPCLYYKNSGLPTFIALAIWVDDILVVSKNTSVITTFFDSLNSSYKATNLGTPKLYLGIRITSSARGITLDQEHYIEDLVIQHKLAHVKTPATPLNRGLYSDPNSNSPPCNRENYQSLIGALLWIARCTRPDIAFTVSWLGRQSQNPTTAHWKAAMQTLAFLKTTSFHRLLYTRGIPKLIGFTDSDFAEDIPSRKSTTGFVFFFKAGDSPISWRSKLQSLVTRSVTEAEYVACSTGAQEATWLSYILRSFSYIASPVPIYVDNQSARALVASRSSTQKTKHIDIAYHYARDLHKRSIISIQPISGPDNAADVLTKAFEAPAFNRAVLMLHLDTTC